ncbi:5-formyltetrahydrofolate cyclo-ligase [Tropicimonas sp. IMCC34043]|uniref:5-formyltetrahydrofolate cyclo-ligase n=1 Tax=Tropicimonas sp. IMCC34043 TaxID=2248760 RepID=UPI000E238DC5|nr:5-formyltetrahydrofolate cyclo-ligase [Tropicimonas sp. IMCC34043]
MTGRVLVAADKAALRRAGQARRALAHDRHHRAASAALTAFLAGLSGRIVAGYLPIRSEADPLPAMRALAGANRIAVPVIEGRGRPLMFHEWTPDAPLQPGPFGVQVPVSGQLVTPEIVIVPLIAFDGRCHRLGYGGGYYDRTIAALRRGGTTVALGFGYAEQEVAALPDEPTDQSLDLVVTEAGVVGAGRLPLGD